MKVVFVSNYFNHHQKPFCEEMYRRLGTNFTFISTTVMREERKRLGYSQNDTPEYVLLSYESEEKYNNALTLINDADVVIAGSAPNMMLLDRIRSGKLLVRYSEHLFKKEVSFLKKVYYSILFRKKDLFRKGIYMLCASAYTASDYESMGMYKKHTYKWGYFPDFREYDIDELLSRKKENTILWCGRFIDWKHPDDAILLARKLRDEGYSFNLNMIGSGVMEAELKKIVDEFNLGNVVHFLGSMPPVQVRTYMEEAGIYLFTSDHQEGWGAVLNESMNSGCAVVASDAIGSVPYLLNDKNGVTYESGNIQMLYKKVKYLLNNPNKQTSLGRHAYLTIESEWNPRIATDRLLTLLEHILYKGIVPNLYKDGPCSISAIIGKDTFKRKST